MPCSRYVSWLAEHLETSPEMVRKMAKHFGYPITRDEHGDIVDVDHALTLHSETEYIDGVLQPKDERVTWIGANSPPPSRLDKQLRYFADIKAAMAPARAAKEAERRQRAIDRDSVAIDTLRGELEGLALDIAHLQKNQHIEANQYRLVRKQSRYRTKQGAYDARMKRLTRLLEEQKAAE